MSEHIDNDPDRKIAYFSMEIGLDPRMPTYSGGLGVLAGDTLKSFADIGTPVVGVTLLNEKGYFYQKIDPDGSQREQPANWAVDDFMKQQDPVVSVTIQGREVKLKAWLHVIKGNRDDVVPVIFLDSNLLENTEYDRTLTSYLYGGDERYRLAQEIILGIGGIRMLQALGYNKIEKFHMNEGHAALLTLELRRQIQNLDKIKKLCVFTTHTPVPAGHDKFDTNMAREMLGEMMPNDDSCYCEGKLNMTHLALAHATYVNGVAQKHKEVSSTMFPNYLIHSITNGVHTETWVCKSMADLLNKYVPEWNMDPYSLRYANNIPKVEILAAHKEAKRELINFVNQRTNAGFDYDIFTIGFARRATAYKRPDLIFRDISKLKDIAERKGPIQIVFAGKAHPKDFEGKEIIKKIVSLRDQLLPKVRITYVDNYDMSICKVMASGVDVWMNTPRRPREASGTSGMKAAHNGVPHFSTLDGWWLEGHIEDVTGWSIGPHPRKQPESDDETDATDLYIKLEHILDIFNGDKKNWARIMRQVISFNGAFFNTHREVQQYWSNAYND